MTHTGHTKGKKDSGKHRVTLQNNVVYMEWQNRILERERQDKIYKEKQRIEYCEKMV